MPVELNSLDFKLSHLGIAVASLGPTTDLLTALFGYKVIAGPFEDRVQKVAVSFLAQSDRASVEIELVAPLTEDSPIKSILAKHGGGAYHLCFETSDLDGALVHAKNNGCIVVGHPVPATAFQGRRIAWIYAPSKQLFELVESNQPGSEPVRSTPR